jgi:hypothetical protein
MVSLRFNKPVYATESRRTFKFQHEVKGLTQFTTVSNRIDYEGVSKSFWTESITKQQQQQQQQQTLTEKQYKGLWQQNSLD